MKKTLLALTFLVLAIGCNKKDTDIEKYQSVSLRQEWFPNSNYCGAVFAKEVFAPQNKLEIDIAQGSDNIDPIKMVISGENDIGDASADRVLEAINKGADLIIIGVLNINSPTCFISKKNIKLDKPNDFEGHRIGILTGTNTEYIYKALKKKYNIRDEKIEEKEVPFDLNTFILDQYDIRPAFVYDEPVSLDLQNISYNILEPKNWGISFLGTVYFTTKKFVQQKPEVVQSFINSICDGWRASLKYPNEAIKHLQKVYPDINPNRELKALIKGEDYFKGKNDKILWADSTDWAGMISVLNDLGKIDKIDPNKFIDNSFLLNYYKKLNSEKDKIK